MLEFDDILDEELGRSRRSRRKKRRRARVSRRRKVLRRVARKVAAAHGIPTRRPSKARLKRVFRKVAKAHGVPVRRFTRGRPVKTKVSVRKSAVTMRRPVARARLISSVKRTAPVLRKKTVSLPPLTPAPTMALKALKPVCRCPALAQARLEKRFQRRGYPPGTANRLLAASVQLDKGVERLAARRARSLPDSPRANVAKRLASMASKLPEGHPTRHRAAKLILICVPKSRRRRRGRKR